MAESELMRSLRLNKLPELATPLFILKGDLGTLDDWQSRARLNSPVLMQIDAKRSQAEEGVRAAEAAFHPQSLCFRHEESRQTLPHGCGARLDGRHRREIHALGQSRSFSNIAASRSQVTQAEAARAEADNSLAQAIEAAFLRTTQAREEFELTTSTMSLAAENLRLREASFAEGLSTAIDLREARTQLVGAEIAQRAAAYKFVVSWAMLHATAGVMPDFEATLGRSDFVNAQQMHKTQASAKR